jgi:orotidine-5'-phosphate decarboxylase
MERAVIAPRDRLIVPLDLPNLAAAEAMIATLGDSVSFYKIGYQLAYAAGLSLVPALTRAGKKVFIDLKLHDIGNTVARGVESIAGSGASFLTVHAYPQTMQAAIEGRAGSDLRILAVTVLTSYDDDDLRAAGYRLGVSELVEARARQAAHLGIDGLVCSPAEAKALRHIIGPSMSLVTPGVRPAGSQSDDQKRTMTPARAIQAGADYLVVGRPITGAADPKAAADAIQAEIAQALCTDRAGFQRAEG